MTEEQFDSSAYKQKMQDLLKKEAINQARNDFRRVSVLNGPDKKSHMDQIEEACKDITYRQEIERLLEAEAKEEAERAKKVAVQKAKKDFKWDRARKAEALMAEKIKKRYQEQHGDEKPLGLGSILLMIALIFVISLFIFRK